MATGIENTVAVMTLLIGTLIVLTSVAPSRQAAMPDVIPIQRRIGHAVRRLQQYAEDDDHHQEAPSSFHHDAVSNSRWADTRWRSAAPHIRRTSDDGSSEFNDQREQRDLARHQLDRYTAGFAAPPIDSGIVEGGPHEEHRQQRVAHPLNGKYRLAPDYQADRWPSEDSPDRNQHQRGVWSQEDVRGSFTSVTSPGWSTPVFNPEAVPQQQQPYHRPVHAQPRSAVLPMPADARFLVSDGERPSRASLGVARRIESFPTLQNQPGRDYEDAILRRTVMPALPSTAPAPSTTTTTSTTPKPTTITSRVVPTTPKITSTTAKVTSTTTKTVPNVTSVTPEITSIAAKVTTSSTPAVTSSTINSATAASLTVKTKTPDNLASPGYGVDHLDVTLGDFPGADTSTFADDVEQPNIGTMFDLSEDFTEEHMTVRIAYPPSSSSEQAPAAAAPPTTPAPWKSAAEPTAPVPDSAVVSEYTASEDFVGTVTMSEFVTTTTTSEWTESVINDDERTVPTAPTTLAPTTTTTTTATTTTTTTSSTSTPTTERVTTTSVRDTTAAPETSSAKKLALDDVTETNTTTPTNAPPTVNASDAKSIKTSASTSTTNNTTTATTTVNSVKAKSTATVASTSLTTTVVTTTSATQKPNPAMPADAERAPSTPKAAPEVTAPAEQEEVPAPRPTSRRRLPSYRPIIRHRVNRPTAAPAAPAATRHPRPNTPRPTRAWKSSTTLPAITTTNTEEEMTDWNTPPAPTEPTTTKRTYVITVPPLVDHAEGRQRHVDNLDSELEATQLSEPSEEDHGHGVIPEGATNAIIISGIIGGCAIVFFAVLMAFCMWKQHMSRRPIYPPSHSSNSSSSTPSSGTFNGKFR